MLLSMLRVTLIPSYPGPLCSPVPILRDPLPQPPNHFFSHLASSTSTGRPPSPTIYVLQARTSLMWHFAKFAHVKQLFILSLLSHGNKKAAPSDGPCRAYSFRCFYYNASPIFIKAGKSAFLFKSRELIFNSSPVCFYFLLLARSSSVFDRLCQLL